MTTSLELAPADLSEATPFSVRIAATRLPQFPRTGIERRAHRRHAAHEIDWVRGARLKNGPDVAVIDLSVGGALVDVNAHLRLGSVMTLEIVGPDDEVEIPFEVLRCYVSNLQGGTTTYRGACAFTQPLQLARLGKFAWRKPSGPHNEFVGLDAALRILLGRSTAITPPNGTLSLAPLKLTGPELLTVLDALRARAQHSDADAYARAVGMLLSAALPRLRRGEPAAAVSAALEAALENVPEAREWEQRLVDTGQHLIALAYRLEKTSSPASYAPVPSSNVLAPPDTARQSAGTPDTCAGGAWQKIVARYRDGATVKGYTMDFNASRSHFSLWPSVGAPTSERVPVSLSRLKAVFFVRDFDGNPTYVERKSPEGTVAGRRIEVTFRDRDVICGTSLNYRPDCTGFFVVPFDQNSNNQRIYVVTDAVRHGRFR
jgi:hypothetical protein